MNYNSESLDMDSYLNLPDYDEKYQPSLMESSFDEPFSPNTSDGFSGFVDTPLPQLDLSTPAFSPASLPSLASPLPDATHLLHPIQEESIQFPSEPLFDVPEKQSLPENIPQPPGGLTPELMAALYAMAQSQIGSGMPPPLNFPGLAFPPPPFLGIPPPPMFSVPTSMPTTAVKPDDVSRKNFNSEMFDDDEEDYKQPRGDQRRRRESPTLEDLEQMEKTLNSKERRQLRNKISARNFRLRRKEYITNLEEELKLSNDENKLMKAQLVFLQNENFMLRSQLAKQQQGGQPGGEISTPAAAVPDFNMFLPPALPFAVPAVPVPPPPADVNSLKLENFLFTPPQKLTSSKFDKSGIASSSTRISVHSVRVNIPQSVQEVSGKSCERSRVDDLRNTENDVAADLWKTVHEIIPAFEQKCGLEVTAKEKGIDCDYVEELCSVIEESPEMLKNMQSMNMTRMVLFGVALLNGDLKF